VLKNSPAKLQVRVAVPADVSDILDLIKRAYPKSERRRSV
jgi:hypothetical protein